MQDDAGSLRAEPIPSGFEINNAPAPALSSLPADTDRHRYAIGVFGGPSRAFAAVRALADQRCEALLISDMAHGDMQRAPQSVKSTFPHIASADALKRGLTTLLAEVEPFAALAASGKASSGETWGGAGTQRLCASVVHHLSAGCAIVIVSTQGSEEQLRVSRALLEAKCDMLLTHDVLTPKEAGPSGMPPAAATKS